MPASTAGPTDDAVSATGSLGRLRTRVVAAATPAAIALALALYLASVAALSIADLPLERHAPGVGKLDLSPGYGHAEAVQVLTAYGPEGRRAYAISTLVDSVMPVFFALVTLLAAARAAPRWWLALAVAPVAFMVLDLVENAAFAVMLGQYPAVSPGLVAATSPVTTVKLLSFLVALPTLIISLLVLSVGALRRRAHGAAGVA